MSNLLEEMLIVIGLITLYIFRLNVLSFIEIYWFLILILISLSILLNFIFNIIKNIYTLKTICNIVGNIYTVRYKTWLSFLNSPDDFRLNIYNKDTLILSYIKYCEYDAMKIVEVLDKESLLINKPILNIFKDITEETFREVIIRKVKNRRKCEVCTLDCSNISCNYINRRLSLYMSIFKVLRNIDISTHSNIFYKDLVIDENTKLSSIVSALYDNTSYIKTVHSFSISSYFLEDFVYYMVVNISRERLLDLQNYKIDVATELSKIYVPNVNVIKSI